MIATLVILLLALMVRQRQVGHAGPSEPPKIAHGYTTIVVLEGESFACASQSFQISFDGNDVMVYLSPARSPNSLPMLEQSVTWVEHVNGSGFDVCVKTSARIFGIRILNIQWLAFNTVPSTSMAGIESIPLWTTGTKCVDISYSRHLTDIPVVFVTGHHQGPRNKYDAANIWTEDITVEGFKICLREIKNFDGVHKLVKVHWLVLDTLPVEWTQAKVKGQFKFTNTVPPPAQFHYSYCQELHYPNPFYSPPTIIATASHTNNIYNHRNVWPINNAITYWIESITTTNYKVCVKDLQSYNDHHDPILVNYLILGDLDPCLGVQCGNYAKCSAHSSSDARCECDTVCPGYKDQLCDQYGTTYSNPCSYEQKVCNSGGDNYIVKNGSCEAFSFKHGRVPLTIATSDYKCTTIHYGATFKLNQPTQIYLAVDYHNTTAVLPHETTTIWAEDVTTTSFRACVLKAGRNDIVPEDGGLMFVNYVAYQGSPPSAVSGEENLDAWWEGTVCKQVNFPQNKFVSSPYILVSAKHNISSVKHDAATIWIEDLNVNNFKVCMRELQTFDTKHEGIVVNWLAFSILPEGILGEQHHVILPNTGLPTTVEGNTFCKNITFTGNYDTMPTILLSAVHHNGPDGLVPDYNSVSAWVETMSLSNCTICTRQQHKTTGRYDPLVLSVVLLGASG